MDSRWNLVPSLTGFELVYGVVGTDSEDCSISSEAHISDSLVTAVELLDREELVSLKVVDHQRVVEGNTGDSARVDLNTEDSILLMAVVHDFLTRAGIPYADLALVISGNHA